MQLRMITLILLTLTISCGNDTTGPAPEETARFLSADPVEFTTSDGFLIRGTFFHDTGRPTAKPVVILLHAFGSSHLDWFTFALDLVDFRNFVVLAIDLRGHGASNFQSNRSGIKALMFLKKESI